jgi:probable HAF family extracellular repeat protein
MKAKTHSLSRLAGFPALWFLCLVTPSFAQLYKVTDLGTLPGNNFSAATAINSFGQVVGYGGHAFLWSKEHGMRDLGTLFSGGPSWAAAINDRGHVTGGSWVDTADNGAFLWTPAGGMQEIVPIGDGQGGMGINDFGEVAGWTMVEPPEAFVWTRSGGEVNLDTLLGWPEGGASGINDFGQVVGFFVLLDGSTHAFRWSEKLGVEDLGPGYANAINLAGDVVGSTALDGHAFLWTKRGGMQDLGTLSGDSASSAAAINFFGLVVGTSGTRAFFWSQWTGMLDLNTLIPRNSGWTLSNATGINIVGQIVGDGIINGQNHAFLLSLTREDENGSSDLVSTLQTTKTRTAY